MSPLKQHLIAAGIDIDVAAEDVVFQTLSPSPKPPSRFFMNFASVTLSREMIRGTAFRLHSSLSRQVT